MTLPAEKQDTSLMQAMFHQIAPRYDFFTRVFSFGMDTGWKRALVKEARLPDKPLVLDLASGRKLWDFEAGAPLTASPAIAAGRVVIGSQDGRLYCFGAAGPPAAAPVNRAK